MDTPTTLPTPASSRTASALPRWLRVGVFLGLILLVQGALAFLLTWVDPPHAPHFVSIRVSDYRSKNLFVGGPADIGSTRRAILQSLDGLAQQRSNTPVVVHLSALADYADSGEISVLPSDASPEDRTTWLRLRDVLEKLQACPARQKLLVLELTPAKMGGLYYDLASAIPRELDAVPDANRLVLCASSPGQTPHLSPELGQSVFAHYLRETLDGHADGYGGLRDGHVSVNEMTAFLQARVDRWTWRNRGERQTPMLLGNGADFTVVSVNGTKSSDRTTVLAEREYPAWLADGWKARDAAFQSGAYRSSPRAFQQLQSTLFAAEQAWRLGHSWARDCDACQQRFDRVARGTDANNPFLASIPDASRRTFGEASRLLQSQLVGMKPPDAEQYMKRFIEEMRGKLPEADLDAVVLAHALADARLDPAAIRLYDQLLHPASQSQVRTAVTLRIKQLADLAMRVEVQAWPRDVVETMLRCAEIGEKSFRETPHLPGYVDLLNEPALTRHAGELRLWTRGYSDLDDAKQRLKTANEQFHRLSRLNEEWRVCEQALDEALCELPWFVEALEPLPELREPWQQATGSARALAETLQTPPEERLPWLEHVERLTAQIEAAQKQVRLLSKHRQALHAPFAKDALARLERQCRLPHADPATLQSAEALLCVASPVLQADDRATLWLAAQTLSRRLNAETLALDREDNRLQRITPSAESLAPTLADEGRKAGRRGQAQIALMDLAGCQTESLKQLHHMLDRCKQISNDSQSWCGFSEKLREQANTQMTLRLVAGAFNRRIDHGRFAWLLPPIQSFTDDANLSPTVKNRIEQNDRQASWLDAHQRYLARDYQGLNLESSGTLAARAFYAPKVADRDAQMRFNLAGSVGPLTETQPYAHVWLEVIRHVPAGAFGSVELQFHRADDSWLEVAPGSATLPALADSKEPRTLTHKVPLKVTRKPKAERTGLPPPIGFLVEATVEGRAYHYLVNVPIVYNAQELQILVGTDPDEPGATLNEIRVRPGKVKQPHYVYVQNLTNRSQKIYVEIMAGGTLLHKSQKLMTLEPDGVRKVIFDAPVVAPTQLRGPITVRVLDHDRHKTLTERILRVEVLSAHDYVRTAEASYEPGSEASNKWAIQVQASKPVFGPAITAQLVLPVQRIPGLMGVGGGTLQVELPTQLQSPRVLFAERLRLVNSAEEEGPVYLNIDGVPRAFVYRTTFSRSGEPTKPRPDDRPAVRLDAPPCVMAGIRCLVDVEVDNAPRGAKLEVALGRTLDDGSFKAEFLREYANAKKHRIGLEATKDALVFDAAIDDWTATFDTRSIAGPRELRSRLIDAAGKDIAHARQAIVIDDSPPTARIVPTPAQVKKGTLLQVQAQGVDAESGIAQVIFFIGRPEKGEIPLAAPRFKAVPANRESTQWSASLQVPAENKGPLAISVHVINHAGMASIDTVTLDVTDREPGKTGLGEIRGKVVEGPRPQPNLLVTLLDERGKEIAKTKTQPDGSYQFTQLEPGRYRVVCVKPESQRRAVLDVTVEPDRASKADLSLAL